MCVSTFILLMLVGSVCLKDKLGFLLFKLASQSLLDAFLPQLKLSLTPLFSAKSCASQHSFV
jgi:hypothetical protein